MLGKKLIKSNDAGGGACTNTVDLYNPFPDGGGVALYQLNGDATDVSGNYNGTASNLNYVAGQFGQGASFNNSNSILTTPRAFSTNGPYSVSGWIKMANGTTTQNAYLFWQITGTNQSTLNVSYDGVGSYTFNVNHKFATNQSVAYTFAANDGQWHHYVATFNGSTCNLYIDNVNVASGPLSPKADVSSTNYLGGTTIYNGITYYNGLDGIDQVRYFNRALRPYEVEALYTEEYCTPTIVPSEHFNTVTYTAATTNGTYDITGSSFQPDLIWVKNRDNVENHFLFDSVRGMTNMTDKFISSNRTVTEATASAAINGTTVTAIDGGFRVVETSITSGELYFNGRDYVSWNFKAGGAAVTNTDGTITSQVSANTEAGFSVVGWTGNGSNGVTIGHGLNSVPDMFIIKDRDVSQNWYIWQKDLAGDNYGLDFGPNPQATFSFGTVGTKTTSTITAVAGGNGISNLNTNGDNYIGYFFSEIEGFSSFGSYVGTGTTTGEKIITGFEPAFVMTKRIDAGSSWYIADNKRNPSDPRNLLLNANVAEVEIVGTGTSYFNFYKNGFQVTASTAELNASGGKYIYMAFAADPTAVEPTLEDSFNTVTYTGNGGTQNIGGVFEGGASFNGSSSKIECPSIPIGTGDFSYSFWINCGNQTVGEQTYVFRQGEKTSERWFGCEINTTTQLLRFIVDDGISLVALETIDITDSAWHFISFVRKNSTIYAYIDNNSYSIVANSNSVYENSTLGIGYKNSTNQNYFNGSIDQLRFFNTALTAAQVTELYEETDADSHTLDFPSGAGAVALYELNGNANDTGGTYNGTATNVTWLNNGVGFQPDFVWIKERSSTSQHTLSDSVRGAGNILLADVNDAELTGQVALTSFDNNGFTVGNDGKTNQSGQTYASWNWKASEIPAINSNGSITSVVSANPAAGFSIVSYTGNNIAGATIGHGLGAEPNVVIVKNRNTTDIWTVQHSALTYTDYIDLSSTNAATTNTAVWYAQPTNEVFSFGANPRGNGSGNKIIAYCFAEVTGFSKFGSYTGTGASGNTVTLGFEPAFLLIKRTDVAGNSWLIADNKRDTTNPIELFLAADTSQVEFPLTNGIDFNPNDFTLDSTNGSVNASGGTYIYMAFANQF